MKKEMIGKKKVMLELTLIDIITYGVEPRYYYDDGIRRIYKFIDENNDIFIWRTSSVLYIEEYDHEKDICFDYIIDPGDKISLSGNIKDISEYRGEEQVVLERVKVYRVLEKRSMTSDEIYEFHKNQQLSKIKGNYEIKTITYGEYKNEYDGYETVKGSFIRSDNGCFIDVIIPEEANCEE